jgi:hypothetical protein
MDVLDIPMVQIMTVMEMYMVLIETMRLQKFNSNLSYQRRTGSNYNRSGPFYSPWGVHVDRNNKVYVADHYNKQ